MDIVVALYRTWPITSIWLTLGSIVYLFVFLFQIGGEPPTEDQIKEFNLSEAEIKNLSMPIFGSYIIEAILYILILWPLFLYYLFSELTNKK